MLKRSLVAMMVTGLSWVACAAQPDQPRPKAVFIIMDGIAADVIEATPTPTLDDIAAHGAYARAYVGGEAGGPSESPTVSAVGYQSLLTGTWSNKHNVWDNAVEAPDYRYWDIFRIAKAHDATLRTALFSTWTDNRTKLLGNGLDEAGGSKLDYWLDGLELDTERFPHDEAGEYIRQIDALVASEAADYIAGHGPDLTWVYLEHTDWVAHEFGDSPQQAVAIGNMDALVGKIWAAVKDRSARAGEDWLFIVTTDHGRDAITGKEHGEQSERERTIWIATNSTRLNERFYEVPGIVDILPTITTHMGIEVPDKVRAGLDGQSFICCQPRSTLAR